MIDKHFYRKSQEVTTDELKELEHFLATKGGRIIGVGQAKDGKGTLVRYSLPVGR
ncbi:hypothetical protein SPD48_14445 [Pseudogracilibacillus sp. SE30717A]|uniref:hypothetical protein n=1 Tax=Pseudogracilibacillus sp. SE30717A TaxID=3098293 RepID=UPI00300E1C2C